MQYFKYVVIAIGAIAGLIAIKTCMSTGPSQSSVENAMSAEYRFKCGHDEHIFTMSLQEMKEQVDSKETRIDENNQRHFTCPECGKKESVEYPERLNDDGTLRKD